jgi:sugar phosphate isomerase/epimerase
MQIKYIGSTWGIELSALEGTLRKLRDAGFAGVEMGVPPEEKGRRELRGLLDDLGLDLVAQQWTAGSSPLDHAKSFEEQYRRGVSMRPLLVNSHTGKDYFSLQENMLIFRRAVELEEEMGVPIAHETHRGRALFSTLATSSLLEAVPQMRLTADFSHWCVVHESLLEDQRAHLDRAIERTIHIHARVGHPEGPQVADPRAPEWKNAVDVHLRWWSQIIEARRRSGVLTITPEFGPPDYMPTLPFTRQPVADLWGVVLFMKELLQTKLQ